MKDIIKNYTLQELEDYFVSEGFQKYRARQLFVWMYGKNCSSFSDITTFSRELRADLSEKFVFSPLTLVEHRTSSIDGTEKFLFQTRDNYYIESVFLKNESSEAGRLTICISSQVGCQMGCTFCQTAKIGFRRNLETGEILDQINQVRRITGINNTNVVFMGMGEPLMNYDNVIKAAQVMNYSFGFHLSVRRITISTCGILPRLEQYMDEGHLFNLAFSLNDTDPDKRRIHMPVENKYPYKSVLDLFKRRPLKSHSYLTVEYVMRKDNISDNNAHQLKKLFFRQKVKINVIPLHAGDHTIDAPTSADIDHFTSLLGQIQVPVTVRKSQGHDIEGACGQLSGRRYGLSPESCA